MAVLQEGGAQSGARDAATHHCGGPAETGAGIASGKPVEPATGEALPVELSDLAGLARALEAVLQALPGDQRRELLRRLAGGEP